MLYHSQKVLGSNPNGEFFLNFLLVHVWVSGRYSGFLPQSKDMQVRVLRERRCCK